ncbi:MAG: arginine deiminase-related protein [Myxococcota bacterium]
MLRALMREVSPSFGRALVRRPGAVAPDAGRAAAQHAAVVAALRALGVEVRVLAGSALWPDCCFVEDAAVVSDGLAFITRPGAESRRGEVALVREALAEVRPVVELSAPLRLDGGDVLRVGDRLLVGLSQRSDPGAVEALRDAFSPEGIEVFGVAVGDALHLKCHASAPVPGLLVSVAGWLPDSLVPPGVERVVVPDAEAYAANTVGVGETVLVAAGYPETSRRLRAHGLEVVELEVDALAAADGSLTCLSVLYSA